MNISRFAKRTVRVLTEGVLATIIWAGDDRQAETEEEETHNARERDAAYLTTGLITAARSVNKAHEDEEDCADHHDAMNALLATCVENRMVALRTIQHLTDIVAYRVDDEDVQRMVLSIVATELEHEVEDMFLDDDDDDN